MAGIIRIRKPQQIRCSKWAAAVAALAPAALLGAALGVVVTLIPREALPAGVAPGVAVLLAGLVGAVAAGNESVWRWAGVREGAAPDWWARGLPRLAVAVAAAALTAAGSVASLLSEEPRTELWAVPPFVALGLVPLLPRFLRRWQRWADPRPIAPDWPTRPPAPTKPAVESEHLTIHSPAVRNCPGCLSRIEPGQRVSTCAGPERHEVHADCVALCHHRCPQCRHKIP